MLPFCTGLVLNRSSVAVSHSCQRVSAPLKRKTVDSTWSKSITQFRRFCTYTARSGNQNHYKRPSKMPQISPEAAKQIKEDERLHAPTERKTGSLSGSIRSRKTEEKYPRYPESFAIELEAVEAESGPHLEAIKKHFSEELDLSFDDWEMVQAALTHYSYSAARRTNDSLSRLGEKALRFILASELQKLDPHSSRHAWFLATNMRFLTRFEFLSSYIDNTLQLGSLTRYHEPSDAAARYKAVAGKEAAQYRQSVVAKSIMALIGVIYKTKGERETRVFVKTLFLDPYKDEKGIFQAPVLQPMAIQQTGGL